MLVMATEALTKDGGTMKSLLLTVVISLCEKSLDMEREREGRGGERNINNDIINFTCCISKTRASLLTDSRSSLRPTISPQDLKRFPLM
jgi:hypothetical protein